MKTLIILEREGGRSYKLRVTSRENTDRRQKEGIEVRSAGGGWSSRAEDAIIHDIFDDLCFA